MKIKQLVLSWLIYAAGAVVAYGHDIIGIIFLFCFFFVLDFLTGFIASLKQGRGFQSSKARWSFAKTFVYFGGFTTILFVGVTLKKMDVFMGILNVAVWSATWFEAVSNVENLMIIFPSNRFLKFMHFILAVEWAKKIPGLSNYLKEEKTK